MTAVGQNARSGAALSTDAIGGKSSRQALKSASHVMHCSDSAATTADLKCTESTCRLMVRVHHQSVLAHGVAGPTVGL